MPVRLPLARISPKMVSCSRIRNDSAAGEGTQMVNSRGREGSRNTAAWAAITLSKVRSEIATIVAKLAPAPAYWEANMESTLASDNREQLDQAANALMTSLRKSRELNIEIRQALLLREQADSTSHAEAGAEPHTTVLRMLSDIVDRVSRP